MTEVTLFKNVHGSVNAALRSGTTVAFTEGRFFTTNKALIAELQAAVDNDNEFGIYIDDGESSIDPNAATPMEQLKKKFKAELLAELAAEGRLVDAGNSVLSQSALQQSMTTTADIPGGANTTPLAQALEAAALVDNTTEQPAQEKTPAERALEKLRSGN